MVSISSLQKSPFSLLIGDTVLAKVVAVNDVGHSAESAEGG
jgi:hypothetical protein